MRLHTVKVGYPVRRSQPYLASIICFNVGSSFHTRCTRNISHESLNDFCVVSLELNAVAKPHLHGLLVIGGEELLHEQRAYHHIGGEGGLDADKAGDAHLGAVSERQEEGVLRRTHHQRAAGDHHAGRRQVSQGVAVEGGHSRLADVLSAERVVDRLRLRHGHEEVGRDGGSADQAGGLAEAQVADDDVLGRHHVVLDGRPGELSRVARLVESAQCQLSPGAVPAQPEAGQPRGDQVLVKHRVQDGGGARVEAQTEGAVVGSLFGP